MAGRYGQMVLQFRTLPLEEQNTHSARQRHLYLGQARPVFARGSYRTETRLQQGHFRRRPRYDFCRSYHQLLAALFSDWHIEGTSQPQRALMAGTPPKWIADRLGIRPMYLNNTFYYVLVRLERPIKRVKLAGTPHANLQFQYVASKAGDPVTASQQLVKRFGTHYVSHFQTGDFVYQVYVYNPMTAVNIEKLFDAYSLDDSDLDGASRLFSPWYASHIGRVTLASAPLEFSQLVGPRLRERVWFRYYQSLFKLVEQPELLAATRQLSGVMVTGVRMRGLSHFITNASVRYRFEEVVSNRFLLWEQNL